MKTTVRQPHIILIVSDQHSRKLAGCYGDNFIRSPNIDRLAGEGVLFNNAYAPSPLCVPSRMALLSGIPPMISGVHHNSQTLPSHVPTLAHSLGAAGYHSVLCGRMHFVGPDQRHGYHERLVGDHSATGTAQKEAPMGIFDGTTGQDANMLHKSGSGLSPGIAYDQEVAQAAVNCITGHNDNKPLFLTVGFYGPHNPYVCTREQLEYYEKRLPPITAEELQAWRQTDHPAMQAWRSGRNLDNVDLRTINKARAAYYGACEIIDGHIGNIIDAAERCLNQENLLVAYISDHGDMAGERGIFWKSNFYEGSAGVPWIMRYAGVIPRATQVNQPVSLLDLAPTLTAYAGATSLPGATGLDLSECLCKGIEPPLRDITSTLSDRRCGPSAMIRRGPWKLIVYHGHERPELYNLEKDPAEKNDLSGSPQCAAIIDELRKALMRQWDPEAVQRISHVSAGQLALIRAADDRQPEEPVDQWQADATTLRLD